MAVSSGIDIIQNWSDIISMLSVEAIKPAKTFHKQVCDVQNILSSDSSGLANTIIDYIVDCVANVRYEAETDNANLTKELNAWLKNINSALRGKNIEVGVNGLARQYAKEIIANSSMALLRTVKSDSDKALPLPDLMWLVDGKDVYTVSADDKEIGKQEYILRTGKSSQINLPKLDGEMIFVQMPFERWGEKYPTPFIIRRGIWKNLKVLELISDKGEEIVRKAIAYFFSILKGNAALVNSQHGGIYGSEEIAKIREHWVEFQQDASSGKTPTAITNFDTAYEHIIPDYKKAIDQALLVPSQRKILMGFGLIEVLEGTGTASRREAVINPKPFIAMVNGLINSYCSLLKDVIESSESFGRKYDKYEVRIKASPVKDFVSLDEKQFLRSILDRGRLDIRSFIEDVLGMDYNIIYNRRKAEASEGTEDIFYPYIVSNSEQYANDKVSKDDKHPNAEIKDTPEAIDFKNAGSVETAPYRKLSELPKSIKGLPIDLQRVWKDVWNKSYNKYADENRAFKLANGIIKKIKKSREMK